MANVLLKKLSAATAKADQRMEKGEREKGSAELVAAPRVGADVTDTPRHHARPGGQFRFSIRLRGTESGHVQLRPPG